MRELRLEARVKELDNSVSQCVLRHLRSSLAPQPESNSGQDGGDGERCHHLRRHHHTNSGDRCLDFRAAMSLASSTSVDLRADGRLAGPSQTMLQRPR